MSGSEAEIRDNNGRSENEEMNERQALLTKCEKLEVQVNALKEVSALRKNVLELREKESKELVEKLKHFEELVNNERKYGQELAKRIAGAELECAALTEKLGQNGSSLREMKIEYEIKVKELIDQLDLSQKECEELREENEGLKILVEADKSIEFKKLEKQLRIVTGKNRTLTLQMSLLNTLFTETEDTPLDMNRIRAIGDLVRESSELPNVLQESVGDTETASSARKLSLDFDGIIKRLDASEMNSANEIPGQESCYQSMDSFEGPVKVLSVSRTFIKIKDLILEKKSLKREIDGLKTLNEKLYKKVGKQENRLFNVTNELNKTWSLVTTLEAQQEALHNSRSALRYELRQKRKLLDKMKSELSLSHDKWTRIKQSNSASQIEWNNIRAEFTRRRLESTSRQSQESAFCEGSASSIESNSNAEEIEATETEDDIEEEEEDEKEMEKRKALEDEAFNYPLDEFVSELVEEIEDIEAAAEEEDENEDEEDDSEVMAGRELNWEGLVNRRALRLRLLEEQCRVLYNKLQASTARNSDLVTKLSNLHDHYGSETSPDPEQGCSSSSCSGPTPTSSTSPGFLSEPSTRPESQIVQDDSSLRNSPSESLISHPQNTVLTVQSEADVTQVVVSEPKITTEFVRLSPENSPSSSEPGHSHSTSKNSLKQNNSDKESSVLMPNTYISSERQNDLLDSSKEAAINISIESTSTETKSKTKVQPPMMPVPGPSFRIPTPPPMPPIRYPIESDSTRSSPDLNVLGRLIIQQLPKRLEMLKQENNALIQEILVSKDNMREAQMKLDCQKRMSVNLQDQLKDQNDTETKLREELNEQQHIQDRLNQELHEIYVNIEHLEREKEKVEHFLDLFITDRTLKKNREVVKSKTFKNCDSCDGRFSLLKKKYHCKGCGSGVCKKCTTEMAASNSRMHKTVRLCGTCFERRQQLDSLRLAET